MTKHYRCLEPKARREHFTHDVVFHDCTPHYEKKVKLQRFSLPGLDGEKSSESELEHEPKPKTATPKPSATASRAAQKTKPRDPDSNPSLVRQLPEGTRRREKASWSEAEFERDRVKERYGTGAIEYPMIVDEKL